MPPCGWDINPPATRAQRRALYRLGMARSLVKKLDVEQADAAIKAMLALREAVGETCPKKPVCLAGKDTAKCRVDR